MKVGDTVAVTIGGHTVAQAEVKEMNDGTAVLIVPATRVEFGTRTELTDLPERAASTTQTIVDEVVRQPSAPVVEGVATENVNPVQPEPTTNVEAVAQAPEAPRNDSENAQQVVDATNNVKTAETE